MVLRCGGIAVAACAEVVVRAVDASETWPHNVLLASGASAKWMPNSGSSYFHILHIQPRQGPRVWSCLVCPCFIPLEAMPTTLLAVTAMGIFTTDHAVATVLGHGVEEIKKCGSCFVRYYKCIVNLPLGQKNRRLQAGIDLLDNASASGTLSTVRLFPLLIMFQLSMARSRLF